MVGGKQFRFPEIDRHSFTSTSFTLDQDKLLGEQGGQRPKLRMGPFPSLVPHCPLIWAKELPNKAVSAFEIKLPVYRSVAVSLWSSWSPQDLCLLGTLSLSLGKQLLGQLVQRVQDGDAHPGADGLYCWVQGMDPAFVKGEWPQGSLALCFPPPMGV